MIRQLRQRVFGKPHRIRNPYIYRLIAIDHSQRPENCVTPARCARLNHVARLRPADAVSVILENVRFPRRNHETNSFRAAPNHPFDQIFAHRARSLRLAIEAAPNRQKLLRKCQRLYAAAHAGRGDDAPHQAISPETPTARSLESEAAASIAATISRARMAAV